VTCSGRNILPCLCYWDGDESLVASLIMCSMHSDFMAMILVSWNWLCWPKLMLCLAMADLSRWYSLMCRWCSMILVSMECPVCQM